MDKLPAVYRHMQNFYRHMDENAEDIEYRESTATDPLPVRAWTGELVRTARDLGISNSYYSQVTRSLEAMGCITLLRRGSQNVGSVVALHHPPEFESFNPDLTRRREAATLTEQRLKNLETLVGGINVGEAMLEIQTRLEILERGNEVNGT